MDDNDRGVALFAALIFAAIMTVIISLATGCDVPLDAEEADAGGSSDSMETADACGFPAPDAAIPDAETMSDADTRCHGSAPGECSSDEKCVWFVDLSVYGCVPCGESHQICCEGSACGEGLHCSGLCVPAP